LTSVKVEIYDRPRALLLIGFNRPETAKKVIDVLRRQKIERIYFAVDGPRQGREDEQALVQAVRNLKDRLDWGCNVETCFREENLGCKLGVMSAIDWFFQNEDEGIILEDDIIPKDDFFHFSYSCLKAYRDNDSIFSVIGFNEYGQNSASNSYGFYEGFYPWGWATWRRVWNKYSIEPKLIEITNLPHAMRLHYSNIISNINFHLRLIANGYLDTWDYQFQRLIFEHQALTIVPHANLIKNIGTDGAHSHNNELNFRYGSSEYFSNSFNSPVIIDNKLQNLYLLENKLAYRRTKLKNILLNFKLYGAMRLLKRKFVLR
jgi:hypothetical protein